MELWAHFADVAPSGISIAKISEVLYLMRPGLYPILDTRLLKAYKKDATSAAAETAKANPRRTHRRNNWAAVRNDLMQATAALTAARQEVREANVAGASDVVDRLTDLRLLDMLTWTPE